MTRVTVLNWLSMAAFVLFMLGDLAFLALGTLFFDDPHVEYGDFVRGLTRPILPALAAMLVGRVGSRWLARSGHLRLAAAVAALPICLGLAALVDLFG